jgi:hypothetical protein
LIALYVEIDDRVIPPGRRGPGQPKRLSDAELVCLAVAQVLLGARSEHHWLRMCYARLGHLFPYLPSSRATTSGSRPLRRYWPRRSITWPRRSITWPGSARPGTTRCG